MDTTNNNLQYNAWNFFEHKTVNYQNTPRV